MESNINSYTNLILYIITWLVTIIVYQKKKKNFDAGSVILISFLIYSIASLILYNSNLWSFDEIHIFPFVYMYALIMISLYPILKYNDKTIQEIQKPSPFFLNSVSLIVIVFSLIQSPKIIKEFSDIIIQLITNENVGQELYDNAMFDSYSSGSGISNFWAIITLAFSNIGILLFFYHLTLKKYNKLILSGLFFSCLLLLLAYITLGQRGLIMEFIFSIIITYFALKKFIQPKFKRYIRVGTVMLFFIVTIPTVALTVSRFSERDGNEAVFGGVESSLYFYLGQSNLYFNNYALDNGGL